MNVLLRMEFSKAFRNYWFATVLLIGCLIGLADALRYLPTETFAHNPGKFYYPESQGCFQAWMSVNTSSVSLLFYQIAPLLAVTPYAWSLSSEQKSGYIAQVYACAPRSRYLFAKYLAVACSAGIVAVAPQLLNLIVLACIYPAYIPAISDAIYTSVFWESIGSELYYNCPLLYVALYCGIDFAMCGLWAGFVLSLACFIRNRVILLVAPYVSLMLLQYVNDRIFVALGGIRGFQVSFFENLYGGAHLYTQDGFIVLGECIVLVVLSSVLLAVCLRRDAL